MIYLLITLALAVLWYLNKTSKNDYFKNPKIEDYELILKLYANFGIYTKSFIDAWEYFCDFPEDYNGTSVINDRWFIKGLEPLSVTHDYQWIVAESFIDLHKSNMEYCTNLRKINANWLWVWVFVFVGLFLVSLFKSIKCEILNK